MWRNYIARNIRNCGENIAKMVGGSYIKAEYDDIINPKPEDNRTADEIIGGIRQKLSEINS